MTNVVVVDDAPVQRAYIARILRTDGDIAVVGQADTARQAIDVVASLRPDVVVLDLQIPGGGQHAIEQIMAFTPTPILVLSAGVDGRESLDAVEALVAGAVDVLPQPHPGDTPAENLLRQRVRTLRGVTVLRHPRGSRTSAPEARRPAGASTGIPVVAIAASTGGPAALSLVLSGLTGLRAPVLVIQHLHPDFVDGFVTWMARDAALPVELARDGAVVKPGVIYIAPAGTHLKLAADRRIVLDPEPETLHRPSANALFHSLAEHGGPVIGVVLTGMGDDGATGLLALRRRGAVTIVQDEETSAVFGMPQAALQQGAAARVVPLGRIAATILGAAQ
ncbi:MAG TPA: chemotaxis protein CheB [Acidimicrobiales bacterium]|nr:chemotaxis protein CheB [Acidimicrobiales bacterium]